MTKNRDQLLRWLILSLTLVFTFAGWHLSNNQLKEKNDTRFKREAHQIIEHLEERMERYEDILLGGVSLIHLLKDDFDQNKWTLYVDSLDVQEKYPGISGIGFIHKVPASKLDEYYERERRYLGEDYKIHPEAVRDVYYPITLVVPVEPNFPAIGLDMAHEKNRYTALMRSRDTGATQFTGPIDLVQSPESPGFLFFVPFYDREQKHFPTTVEERRKRFVGAVYAPFVVKNLMLGILSRENRNLQMRIYDDNRMLFSDVTEDTYVSDYNMTIDLEKYGRVWTFKLKGSPKFDNDLDSNEPLAILLFGIIICVLLFVLLRMQSTAHIKAIQHEELDKYRIELERSLEDLEQFAYIASHDLQEPLRKIASFVDQLEFDFVDKIKEDENARFYMSRIQNGVQRMRDLIESLLLFSRATNIEVRKEKVSLRCLVEKVIETGIDVGDADIILDNTLSVDIFVDKNLFYQLLMNLISNAIKFKKRYEKSVVKLYVETEKDNLKICVEDNGIGIDMEYIDKVFTIFQRLHTKSEYPGSGVGLAICKKVALRHSGNVEVESSDQGTIFKVILPREKE